MTETNNKGSDLPVVLIAGPTASGKSKIALKLAQEINGAIINADSMQVYRELRVLSARPSEEDEARAPHFLYGTVSVAETYSVGRWIEDVLPVIEKLRSDGQVPIVVGGTGLYFKALTDGLAEMPSIPDQVRRGARARFNETGPAQFHALLKSVDAKAASQIPAGDTQRMIRAYEVFEASGRSIVEWQADQSAIGKIAAPMLRFALTPPRDFVYSKIDARLDAMIQAGALQEVAVLKALDLDPALPAMKALGMAAFIRHLDGKLELDDALALAKTGTRQYAKRQMTWIRNQMVSWNHCSAQENNKIYQEIYAKMIELGLTSS